MNVGANLGNLQRINLEIDLWNNMKAVGIINKKLVVEETEKPIPKDDEVLIKVKAAGLNRADIAQKNGLYPPPVSYTHLTLPTKA